MFNPFLTFKTNCHIAAVKLQEADLAVSLGYTHTSVFIESPGQGKSPWLPDDPLDHLITVEAHQANSSAGAMCMGTPHIKK